jgi:Tfp pilus assembly protein PilX
MRNKRNKGSVILLAVFTIALMSTLVIGILQVVTEEIQLAQNHIYSVQAIAVAEAGLNDAFYKLRTDSSWNTGFTDKAFGGSSYTVTVAGALPNLTIESTGTSAQSFMAKIAADVTIGTSAPYIIRIDESRLNE